MNLQGAVLVERDGHLLKRLVAALRAEHLGHVAGGAEAGVAPQNVRPRLVDQLAVQRHYVQAHLDQHVLHPKKKQKKNTTWSGSFFSRSSAPHNDYVHVNQLCMPFDQIPKSLVNKQL